MDNWPLFAQRLAGVLTTLAKAEQTSVLIIAEAAEPNCYVQFSCGGDAEGIWSEVVSDKYRPRHRKLTEADVGSLREAGWQTPSGPWWKLGSSSQSDNWWRDDFRDPDQLANEVIRVLRDIHHLDDPKLLNYQAFERDSGTAIDLPQLHIDKVPAG